MIIYLIILLTALPVGWILSRLCDDELIDGIKWFRIILLISIVVLILSIIFYQNLSLILVILYFIIIVLIALIRGLNKKSRVFK